MDTRQDDHYNDREMTASRTISSDEFGLQARAWLASILPPRRDNEVIELARTNPRR